MNKLRMGENQLRKVRTFFDSQGIKENLLSQLSLGGEDFILIVLFVSFP